MFGSRSYSPSRGSSVSPDSSRIYYGSSRSTNYSHGYGNTYAGSSHATETYARDSGASLALGQRYFAEGQYDRAAEAFLQAVLADPEAGIPKMAYGHALFAAGDYDRAAYALRRGMDRMANWGEKAMNRRDFYSDPAEFDRQLQELERYVELNPSNPDAQFLLGYNLYFTGRYERAAEYFGLAMRADPKDGHAAYLHGLATRRLESPPSAIRPMTDSAGSRNEPSAKPY